MAVKCPHCLLTIQVNAQPGGQELSCPRCGKKVSPGSPAAPEPLPPGGQTISKDEKSFHLSPKTPTEIHDAPGTLLPPDIPGYRFDGVIGQGGMGTVWLATQLSLNRRVAVKLLFEKLSRSEQLKIRFEREAAVLAKLSHPHVIQIFDRGVAGCRHYFVMEYIEGPGGGPPFTLHDRIGAGGLSPRETQEILIQVCLGLDAAHKQGIIHRDVKPSNILIDREGRIKVTDFGIAHITEGAEGFGMADLTQQGAVIGTIRYMAPEQETDPRSVDQRADVYSVGRMIYHMLTGTCPTGPYPPPPSKKVAGLDPAWDQIVDRAVAFDIHQRYPDMSALRGDIERVAVKDVAPGAQPAGVDQEKLKGLIREAEAALDRGDQNYAQGALHRVLGMDPGNARAQRLSHELRALQNRENLDALIGKARSAYASCDFDECIQVGQRVLELNSQHAPASRLVRKAGEAKVFVVTLTDRALRHHQRGDPGGAEKNLLRILKKFSGHGETSRLLDRFRQESARASRAVERARALFSRGEAREALQALSAAVEILPNDPALGKLRQEIEDSIREAGRRRKILTLTLCLAVPLVLLGSIFLILHLRGRKEENQYKLITARVEGAGTESEIREALDLIDEFQENYPDSDHSGEIAEAENREREKLVDCLLDPLVTRVSGKERLAVSPGQGDQKFKNLLEENSDLAQLLEKEYANLKEQDEDALFGEIVNLWSGESLNALEPKIGQYRSWYPAGEHAREVKEFQDQLPAAREKIEMKRFEEEIGAARSPEEQLKICDSFLDRFQLPLNRRKLESARGKALGEIEEERFQEAKSRVTRLKKEERHPEALALLERFLQENPGTKFRSTLQGLREEILREQKEAALQAERAALEAALESADRAFAGKDYLKARLVLLQLHRQHTSRKYVPELIQRLAGYSARVLNLPEGESGDLRREAREFLLAAWEIDVCNGEIQGRLVELGSLWKSGKWVEQEEYAKTAGLRKDSGGAWCREEPCDQCKNSGYKLKGYIRCRKSGTWDLTKTFLGKTTSGKNLKCEELSKYLGTGGRTCPICKGRGWVECTSCNRRGIALVPVDWASECDPCVPGSK